jgi:hypothetical protein
LESSATGIAAKQLARMSESSAASQAAKRLAGMGESSAASLAAKQLGWMGESSALSLAAKQLGWMDQSRKSLELITSRYQPLLASERASHLGASAVQSSVLGLEQRGLFTKHGEFAKSIAAMNANAGLLKAASRQAELFSEKLTVTSTFSQRIRPLAWATPPLADILPRHYLSSAMALKSVVGINQFDAWSLIGGKTGVGSLDAQMRPLQELSRLQATFFPKSLQESFEKSRRLFAAVDRVVTAWEDNALWFILSCLGQGSIYLIDGLDPRKVELALLDALEMVVREGRYTKALRDVIAKAPYITGYQRDILIHALEHAENGDFRFALSQLMDGLEGALLSAAIGLSVVDQDRWLVGKPKTRRNRTHSIDRVIREMSLDSEYRRFLHRRVFGKVGNPVRHGDVDDGERRQVLLGIVALAGWVDVFMSLKARPVLVEMMSDRLPTAVKQLPQ